ncbi:MAG: hypothetical protein IPK13_19535 [Deltaproteobacteria bacterium]|nr:hypothetical protein [Deltaproteobacteria bacterium]
MRESGSDLDNWTIGGVAITVAAAIAASVLFLQALVYHWQAKEHEKKTVIPQALRDHQSLQASKLNDYAWVDREKGLVRIPIDQAMNLFLSEATAHHGQPGGENP